MAEYIKRKDAVKALGDAHFKNYGNAIMIIKGLPAADVKRVLHGKWIFDCERIASDGWKYRQYHCSLCGIKTYGGTHNFCMNCGADMREG